MGAPVCNVNPANPPPQSVAPKLPSIPLASTDPLSLQNAVNAIRQWIIQYTNQTNSAGNNSVNITNPGNKVGTVTKPAITANFNVTSQRTTITRIYDPNDPTKQTYVDVEQVVGVEWQDLVSGQLITWSQPTS